MMVAENYIIVISTGRQTGVVIPYRVRTVHRDPTGDRTRDRTTTSYHRVARIRNAAPCCCNTRTPSAYTWATLPAGLCLNASSSLATYVPTGRSIH